jgi:hypothetical protein
MTEVNFLAALCKLLIINVIYVWSDFCLFVINFNLIIKKIRAIRYEYS